MMNKIVSSQILNRLDRKITDMMEKIIIGRILIKLYTPIWFLGTNKKYFKIQVKWSEDVPIIKAYLNDLCNNMLDLAILEMNNGTPYYVSYNLKLKSKKTHTYGSFGLIKGRSQIDYEIKERGTRVLKMVNEVENTELIENVKSFIDSNEDQESFFVNDEDVQVLRLKDEPKYQTYWFKVAYLKYSKIVVFKNVQDMDSLARELADSMVRSKKTKLHNN